jgi:hypothetical protein
MLPSYQRMELVKIEGANFQKYVRDMVENGKDLCLQSSSTVTLISQDGNRMDGCNYFGVL